MKLFKYHTIQKIEKGDKSPNVPFFSLPKNHKYYPKLTFSVEAGNILEADEQCKKAGFNPYTLTLDF